MSNENLDPVATLLKQYEASNKPSYEKKEGKVYDLKNYFNTFLKPNETTKTVKIRIVPTSNGTSPFVEMDGHKIQVDGDWKTYACLKSEKKTDCPFCEAREALIATGTDQNKELAKNYSSKKIYIVKVIDRDNEADGVKFWRFNHDYRKTGNFDKISGIVKAVGNIMDAKTGRDLSITVSRDSNKRPVVSGIVHNDPSPLTTDQAQLSEWLSDSRTWEDVYSVRDYAYLEIVVKGGIPAWDKEAKKFVDKASLKPAESDNLESELTLGVPNVKSNIVASTPTTNVAPATVPADEDSDLGF